MNQDKYRFIELFNGIEEELIAESQGEWKKERKKIFFPGAHGMRVACAVLILVIGMAGAFHTQIAEAFGRFVTYLGELQGNNRELEEHTNFFNITESDHGVNMTINEVILDEYRLLVAASVSFDAGTTKQKEDYEHLWAYIGSMEIDGEYIDSLMISGAEEEEENGQMLLTYSFADGVIPDEMSEIKLVIWLSDFRFTEKHEGVGKFNFTIPVTKDQIMAKVTTLPLDIDMDAGDGLVFHLEKISYTDIGSRVLISCSADPRVWEGEGENRYCYIPYQFYIADDQGNQMNYDAVGEYDGEEVKELLYESGYGTPPAADAKYLKIRLYKAERVNPDDKQAVSADGKTEDAVNDEDFNSWPEQIGEEVRVDLK